MRATPTGSVPLLGLQTPDIGRAAACQGNYAQERECCELTEERLERYFDFWFGAPKSLAIPPVSP